MYNYYDGQNQNMSPYNNYGRMNYNPLNNGMNMKNLPHYEVIRVNGRAGAEAFQMAPNSQVLLLDETAPIVWLKTTDGAGYPSLIPYDIEMRHASILHNDVEIMIDTHDVPSDMMALWDYMRKKNIDKMQEAKTLQLLYKG